MTNFDCFEYEFSDGWRDIVKPLEKYIENYNKSKTNEEDKIIVLQAKEKFGTLRFYCNFYTDELREMIRKAEQESMETCEFCGSKENVGTTCGWITTCCEKCINELGKKRTNGIYRWRPLIKTDKQIKWYEFSKEGKKTIFF